MQLSDAVKLVTHERIHNKSKSVWADLGCGTGLFTLALATRLSNDSMICAVDQNEQVLKQVAIPPTVRLEKIKANFITDEMPFDSLDGILMANSLHFAEDKEGLTRKLGKYLNTGGSLLIIEYDMDIGNTWVPFPVSYTSSQKLLVSAGFQHIEKISEIPSLYNRANIYSIIAYR